MRDFLILLLGCYIFATSFFAVKYFSQPIPSHTVTPVKQLVLPNIQHKVILTSGETIIGSKLLNNADRITITNDSGLQLSLPKSSIKKIAEIPSEKVDKRLFVLGSITGKQLSPFEEILFFSDVMWVFWFLGILWISMKKKLHAWQGSLIAAAFCLTQSFVATWVLGKYPGSLLIAAPNISTTLNHFMPKLNHLSFWGVQIAVIAIIPTIFFFGVGKIAMRRKIIKLRNQDNAISKKERARQQEQKTSNLL